MKTTRHLRIAGFLGIIGIFLYAPAADPGRALAQHVGHGGAPQPPARQPAKAQAPVKSEAEEAPLVEVPARASAPVTVNVSPALDPIRVSAPAPPFTVPVKLPPVAN